MAKGKQQRIDPRRVAKAARSSKVVPPKAKVKKATAGDWIAGARIRTLPVSIAPVAMGTAAAMLLTGENHWVRALLCLVVAVSIQIGANYANDYSDGIRGTDQHRVGPSRLTGSGAAKPKTVLTVALVFFGIAALAGVAVVVLSGQWWLLLVGAACIAAAWFYVGGKRPYGYAGLGELFAFIFFGPVPVLGTMYVQVGTVTIEAVILGVANGLFTCAVLIANNIRDIEQDRLAGKRTLSVKIGMTASRVLYCLFMLLPFVILVFFALLFPLAVYVFFALLIAIPACIIVATGKTPGEFLLALKLASVTLLVYGLGLSAALVF
ncbi:1,4-dihydroxy-2-naphthoate polyprenyltransferase [Homoserinimonas hongtaonis]|uniref:1,4-dihydroxy-2-naphthoate octaprenyltransferase n=1 Tax=Homoserinimonas hongtaonis TaxID=2079791 RepID=A0A2U1T2C6_9MICO|nr:1,4-dihydroxy-2-naphthoate polyprenyltransferase [Salinibacterium hongtaonis]PWB98016.1 1,4-dihydroxy-2-naphthoate polyprenyltransferase [Salinibacterium hongtaonis]